MTSVIGDPSVLLWWPLPSSPSWVPAPLSNTCAGCTYDGPARLWRELLLGSGALTGGAVERAGHRHQRQGLAFEIGYHPLKIFGGLLLAFVVMVMLVGLGGDRPLVVRPTGGGRAWPRC
jgi:hypothetical protein